MSIKTLSIVLILSFASSLHADQAPKKSSSVTDSVPLRELSSVTDSVPLSELLSVVSDVAADGPSLSYFGWTESAPTMPERVNCYPAGLHEATEYLVRLVDSLDWATNEQQARIDKSLAKGLEDFREILGAGLLDQCEWEISEKMSFTRVTQFVNQDTGYQITFSLGFED